MLDKLKLSKPLVRSMTEAGFLSPREIQSKTMSRIVGGQDLIMLGPEGAGKTTAYVLGVLMRLKYGVEEAPRALILVPDANRVQQVIGQFELLNRNQTIRIVALHSELSTESQMDALADGTDIVVATPDKARAIYLKLGLNLNKIIMFIVDDTAEMIRKGMQLPISELARSIVRCQHLVITEVIHDKLHQLIDPFMNQPALVEVSGLTEQNLETCEQILYKVPDFRLKQELLQLLMDDADVFNKVIVFVNTRLTAEKVFKNLFRHFDKAVSVYKPLFFDHPGFDDISEFKQSEDARILLVADDLRERINLDGIPFIIHMEIPTEKETFIQRVLVGELNSEMLAISFATDIELSMVTKIEQAQGNKIQVIELPEELNIIKVQSKGKKKSAETPEEPAGAAFHEKKKSNAKDYNYSSKEKAKMKFKNR